jgi:hypothetical protein
VGIIELLVPTKFESGAGSDCALIVIGYQTIWAIPGDCGWGAGTNLIIKFEVYMPDMLA